MTQEQTPMSEEVAVTLSTRIAELEAENAAQAQRIADLEGRLIIQAEFVDNFFAPWGSWKTAWWESTVGDHAAFSAENALNAIANNVRATLNATPKEG